MKFRKGESMKISRRTFIKRTLKSIVGILGLTGAGYYYARFIEPDLLTVQRYKLESERIPLSFDQFKIIQFSDTHIGFHYDLKQLNKLINTINNESPDLILFTGDLVDAPHQYTFTNELPFLLSQLKAPSGKYWIYGNHDHGGYGTEKIQSVMEDGGFQLLKNQHTSIHNKNDSFILAGLDDIMLGKPDLSKTLEGVDDQAYTMLLVHEPDVADQVRNTSVDVQLSGHSHGGQIQLPFYGPAVTPPYAQKYIEGHHSVRPGLDLYISRGIGMTRMPYRFLCLPEISVFQLQAIPKSSSIQE
ncbi:metallophosphoesterase [Halobacillus yeomjeoni]|nr:metallophosphoesterase [Halobacillus yeomjeoni]